MIGKESIRFNQGIANTIVSVTVLATICIIPSHGRVVPAIKRNQIIFLIEENRLNTLSHLLFLLSLILFCIVKHVFVLILPR